jgi:hypothetical protein
MNKLETYVGRLTTERLRDTANGLHGDYRDGADEAMDAILAELAKRLPAPEFVSFCETL